MITPLRDIRPGDYFELDHLTPVVMVRVIDVLSERVRVELRRVHHNDLIERELRWGDEFYVLTRHKEKGT